MDQLAIDVLKTALYHRVPAAGEVTKETIRQLNDHAILTLSSDAPEPAPPLPEHRARLHTLKSHLLSM